jgi:hypothetical protein
MFWRERTLLDMAGSMVEVSRDREEIFNWMADFGFRPFDVNGADMNGSFSNSAKNVFFYEI